MVCVQTQEYKVCKSGENIEAWITFLQLLQGQLTEKADLLKKL